MKHYSVMLPESIEGLNIKEDGIYVDGTLGGAGHSSVILKNLSENGKLIGIDRDKDALKVSTERLSKYNNFYPVHSNHANIINVLKELNISGVDGILLDLGVSSYQLDEASRGFSYMHDAPLDMRMNREDTLSAYDVVNSYSLNDLIRILREYGEEPFAYQIAKQIVKVRDTRPIETTFQLVDVIKSVLPQKVLKKVGHPAKQTFQAIRIEVNRELEVLETALKDACEMLNSKGRV